MKEINPNSLDISLKKTENTNQINFNLFYKALNQKLGIIILMDNNKKYCLHQIKTLFFSLYNHLAEQYVEYIIKYSYLYFLVSEEENSGRFRGNSRC